MLEWQWLTFAQLSNEVLYTVLAKRQEVFALEQNCVYQDVDGYDIAAHHLLGWQQQDGKRDLVAYMRCLAPGVKYPEASIGRVLSAAKVRGSGVGKQLLETGLRHAERQYPGQGLRISAQLYLQDFYGGFGFAATTEPYLEDDILHIEMLRA